MVLFPVFSTRRLFHPSVTLFHLCYCGHCMFGNWILGNFVWPDSSSPNLAFCATLATIVGGIIVLRDIVTFFYIVHGCRQSCTRCSPPASICISRISLRNNAVSSHHTNTMEEWLLCLQRRLLRSHNSKLQWNFMDFNIFHMLLDIYLCVCGRVYGAILSLSSKKITSPTVIFVTCCFF
jgi:hypothetical protein